MIGNLLPSGKQDGHGRQGKVEKGGGNAHGPATAPCDAWSEDLLFCDCGRNGQQNPGTLARFGATTATRLPLEHLSTSLQKTFAWIMREGRCGAAMQVRIMAAACTGVADPPTGAVGAAVTPGMPLTTLDPEWRSPMAGRLRIFDQRRGAGQNGHGKEEREMEG